MVFFVCSKFSAPRTCSKKLKATCSKSLSTTLTRQTALGGLTSIAFRFTKWFCPLH